MRKCEEGSQWRSYYAGGALVDPAVAAAARDAAMAERDRDRAAGDDAVLPRLALADIERRSDALLRYLGAHGYVVLTDIGAANAACYAEMERQLGSFFDGDGESEAEAAAAREVRCRSTGPDLYKSEKGIPMWNCGYEYEQMRDAFRFPAGHCAKAQRWPSARFRRAWLALLEVLQATCDRCLAVAAAAPVQVDLPGGGFYARGPSSSSSSSSSAAAAAAARCRRPVGVDSDKSVSYAVRYPNNRGGQQAEGINIKEHKDPSLFVIEPVATVQGLEVWDFAAGGGEGRWVQAEAACEAGREFVLFGGKALERVTGGRIPAAPHRVTHAKEKRTVFIFEQKYAEFFDDPSFDF